ncbi:MAG: hypothetical protein KDB03_01540 [Planctomycetales bacterium]|nr:hypothetical protein [Planctomycetales bacterium]
MVANSQPRVEHVQWYIDSLAYRLANEVNVTSVAVEPTILSDFDLSRVDAFLPIDNLRNVRRSLP